MATQKNKIERLDANEKRFGTNCDYRIRLVNTLTVRYVKEKIDLGKDHSIVEVETPKRWVGKTFSDLALRQRYSMNVVCVKRGDTVIFPSANYVI